MPRTREDNQRIKDERREGILNAARGVFARKTLGGTKIGDVAAAAGVSHGLVYHYFESKEAVYTALVVDAAQSAVALTSAALGANGTPWERITWLCEQMLSALREAPEHLVLVLQAFTNEAIPDEASSTLLELGNQSFAHVERMVTEGQRTGEVAAGDPTELTLLFFSAIQGLTINRFADRGRLRPTPSVETVLRTLRA